MILVTGATGSVGYNVIRELHMSGCEVRALSRNPKKVSFPEGVEATAGDLTKPETLQAALNGVEKVFWVLPLDADFNFPKLARQHGVRHIVLLSALAVDFGSDNAIARLHLDAEQAVRESGADWTFLRPGGFMTNSFQWAHSIRSEGIVRIPFGDISTPSVDSRDIAAVAAKALSTDGHEGKIYSLTGPEPLTPRQQVHILSDLLGRDLGFETLPDDIARQYMLRQMPAEIVDAFFDLNRQGFSTVLPTVEEVTGRAPFTFKQWATDHIDAFR
ncbi:SDR family oxidoreductase [Paenibacillus alkalitolerans]|uniref:SDR family oxidoreductase n=1 Tax=Paenibacillus alkalitolerans TaxID=2799335 RepID=UPI0018F3B6A0|nr:SDR family oxidoreductase [Paenibacillus alkalitolerans]